MVVMPRFNFGCEKTGKGIPSLNRNFVPKWNFILFTLVLPKVF